MGTEQGVVRVAVVDDYEVVTAGIVAVLQPYADQVQVVELDSNVPVISQVDIVLYDSFAQVQGPDIDLSALIGPGVRAKVVVFSWNTGADLVERSLAAGVDGYIAKSVTGPELVAALQRVHAGERVVPKETGGPRVPGEESTADDDFGRWPGTEVGLSPREAEVLALICQGLSNDEISRRTHIGLATVKTYVRTAYRKIGVDSRTRAVLWGLGHGFGPDTSRTIRHP